MRRAIAASVVALLAAVPAAHAYPPPPPRLVASPIGDCGLSTVNRDEVTGTNTHTGSVDGYAVLWDEASPTTPVGATIRCDVTVNGELVASTPEAHGTAVAVTGGLVSFTATDVDWVEVCLHVEFDDGRVVDCPVQPCRHMFNIEYMSCWNEILDWTFEIADPPVCAVLSAAAPGYGPVRIEPGGDVYLLDELWFDCPPYVTG